MKLIDKSALVAEIERMKSMLKPFINIGSNTCGRIIKHLDKILSFLNTLEVKEVDLEKELSTYLEVVKATDEDIDFVDFAKHFFELGMQVSDKAQKGE